MRIISGKYGRRRFDVPTNIKARPTTDFARENIFNVLENLIDFKGIEALDLFARNRSHQFRIIIARMQPGGMRGNLSDTIQFYPQSPTTTQRPESDSYQGRCVQVRTKLPATIRPHFCRSALRSAPVGNPAAGSAIERSFETGRNLRSRTFQKQ